MGLVLGREALGGPDQFSNENGSDKRRILDKTLHLKAKGKES